MLVLIPIALIVIALGYIALRKRAKTVAEANERIRRWDETMQAEYRRAHLIGVAQAAVISGQGGPTYHSGTVSATAEEMARVLGPDWREHYGKPTIHAAGTMGTAYLPRVQG